MIRNYRVNFGGDQIDYRDNFKDCRQYFPILERLYGLMTMMHISDCWHFFEPYVEFTWVVHESHEGHEEDILQYVLDILKSEGIEPTLIHRPDNGIIVDWYCKNPDEQVFGYKTYAISAQMAMLFWRYREAIEKGCGEERQFMRRPHVLANQIGMNYNEEAQALASRSIMARLFWDIGDHEKAVAAYEDETGEKYF